MVCTGRSKALLALIVLVALTSSSCSRWQKSPHPEAAPKTFSFTPDQVPALLSGVWYHIKGEQPNKLVEREFSWGKTEIRLLECSSNRLAAGTPVNRGLLWGGRPSNIRY